MRNYERNGVHVDQCTECRGIFLDRGELEQIMDAEQNWNSGNTDRGDQSSQSAGGLGAIVGEAMQQARGNKSYDKHSGYDKHGEEGYRRRKKESFLGDLFG